LRASSSLFFLNLSLFGQVHKITVANKLLNNPIEMKEVKKILANEYTMVSEGELSDAGNINYEFKSKINPQFRMILLYSTAFNRVAYIQAYDELKFTEYYKKEFMNLGFSYIKTIYGKTQQYGYKKNNFLYTIELGVEKGKCKLHLINQDL
jgi:hypothetical protein